MRKRQQRVLRLLTTLAKGADRYESALRPLAAKAGISLNTLRLDLEALAAAGWLELRQGVHRRSVFVFRDPHDEKLQNDLASIKRKLDGAPFLGEAIVKAILDLLVDTTKFQDNARPSFLRFPGNLQALEYDRFYSDLNVAVEINGTQHQRTTEQYPSEEQLVQQQIRDLVKFALSVQNGVKLIVVEPQEFTVASIRAKLAGHLPLRNLAADDPRLQYLDNLCVKYRSKASRVKEEAATYESEA